MGGLRPRYLPLAAADLAGAVTIVALLRPEVQFAYHAPSFHVMIETVAAMAALIAAYLVYGRFRHGRNASDLVWYRSDRARLGFSSPPSPFSR